MTPAHAPGCDPDETLRLYEDDSYLRESDARIVDIQRDGKACVVALDRTMLFPGGGGQPGDRGWLGEIPIIAVDSDGRRVRHTLDSANAGAVAVGSTQRLRLDWKRRWDHMQQHTAQHVITAVALASRGWATTAFHLGAESSDIEVDVVVEPAELAALEEDIMNAVRAAAPVRAFVLSAQDFAEAGIRSRGLPEGHQGDVRVVEIEGVDRCNCGGTHLRSTAEIETIKLLGVESLRGGSRIRWVAGKRVRTLLGERERRAYELRAALDVGDDDVRSVLERRVGEARALKRRVRRLERDLAVRCAAELAGVEERVVSAHYSDAGPAFLEAVGHAFAAAAGARLALLTAEDDGACYFAVVSGDQLAAQTSSLGARVAEVLDGRGGGRPGAFQGRAASLRGRQRAQEFLAGALQEGD